MSLQELEQIPFNTDEFIERLIWRSSSTAGGRGILKSEDFDASLLHAAFKKTIVDLDRLNKDVKEKILVLEQNCEDEQKLHWQKVNQLQKNNTSAFNHFKTLDERINFVATKVVHLGDQLEGVNQPRLRAQEAQMLMKYFAEFLEPKSQLSHLFNDPFQLQKAANVINKLYNIIQELPYDPKFDVARSRILDKYNEIEKRLVANFKQAYFDKDKDRMKEIINILSLFKGYEQCVSIFIEESQVGALNDSSIFNDIIVLVDKTKVIIEEIFSNPESVLTKFILNIYQVKLQHFLDSQLRNKSDLEKYLNNLLDLYLKTNSMSQKLTKSGNINDALYIDNITKNIFGKYLDIYIVDEMKFLKDKCSSILHSYYENKRHQKKQIQTGGIYDLRRDLQAAIGAHTNINIGGTANDNYGSEIFLSQEVAINILQEYKLAFKRCQLLSTKYDVPINAVKLLDFLFQYLCVEHVEYAIELCILRTPSADTKSEPELYFFEVVSQTNTIIHLLEKQYTNNFLPLVAGTLQFNECLLKKRQITTAIESKLDAGLDKSMAAMIGWIRFILTSEQKKTDFRQESEEALQKMFSEPCEKVCNYVNKQIEIVNRSLDGKNVDVFLDELGIRFHKVVYDHLLQFQYNSIGAMLAICDVNKYRKCAKQFQSTTTDRLFNVLHALCNLLAVVPENLKVISAGEELKCLDRSIINSFLHLRIDYKNLRFSEKF